MTCFAMTVHNALTMANPEEDKETFYSQLKGTHIHIPSTNKLLLKRDFNARITRENDKWPQPWSCMGSGNVIPTASFFWHYAVSLISK